MTENGIINISLAILFLPLLGFIVTLLLGKKVKSIYLFEIFIISVILIASIVVAFGKLSYFIDDKIITELEWFRLSDTIAIKLGFLIDNITVLMLFVVALISALVHYFSIAYMKGDERYNRYFALGYSASFSFDTIIIFPLIAVSA